MSDKKVKITTVAGVPYINDQKSLEAGKKGPLLLKDFTLIEKLSHFSRERIPERVVHAKGTGAYGTFKVTNDITKYTHAKVFDTLVKLQGYLHDFLLLVEKKEVLIQKEILEGLR